MKKLLLCFMLVAGGITFGADNLMDDDLSPWEYWRQGFESFERGEQLLGAKKNSEAMAAYLKAKQAFLKVKQAKPNWRQDVIMKRVKLCDEKISLLEFSKLAPNEIERSRNTRYNTTTVRSTQQQNDLRYSDENFSFSGKRKVLAPVAVANSRDLRLLKTQLKSYREKLFAALIKLEEYRNKDKRSSNALNEIESLIKEKSDLNSKYQLLLGRYSALQQRQQMPQAEKNALKNKLIEEKMHSDLLEQKVKMYLSNIQQLQDKIAKMKQDRQKDTFTVRKSDAKVTALEDEIKRLSHNIATQREQTRKVSQELAKQKYITEIEQRNAKRYKSRLATLNKWLNNRDKTKAAAINQKIAQENIALTKQMSEIEDKKDALLRENLTLKNKLTEAHANSTQLKNMLSSIEIEKKELKQRLKDSANRAKKHSGASTIKAAELDKLRRENQQLRKDLNLFGKSYAKHSGKADAGTLSQYKLIIDKLNAQLANEKAVMQQYKLTHQSSSDELTKLEDDNNRLQTANLDLIEENKNLQAFVKDYDAAIKASDKLKKQLAQSNATTQELIKLKKAWQELLRRNKTLTDKLKKMEQKSTKQIVVPVKDKNSTADSGVSQKEIERLRQQNSSLTAKVTEYSKTIAKLEKEQEALAAHVGQPKKDHAKKLQAKQAQVAKLTQLQKKLEQLQQKVAITEKKLVQTQQNQAISKKQLAEKKVEINRLKTQLSDSRKASAKYQSQLKQRIQQAVKIKKTAPQQLAGKLSDQQIAFLLQEGIRAEKNNDDEAAAWHYQKIITNIATHPEANRRLGLINLNRGNYKKSTQQLEKALRAAPKDIELLLAFSAALANGGNPQAALKTIKQAIVIEPNNSRVYILNGTVLQQLKKDKAAETSFRQALTKTPNSAEANLKMSQLLATDKKRYKEARDYYHKALKLGIAHDKMLDKKFKVKPVSNASEAVLTLRKMAIQHTAKKDYIAAAWCYSQLISLDPKNAELKLSYGTVLLLDGKYKQSLPLLKVAATAAKDKLTAQLLLGANYLLLNKNKMAAQVYKQALTLLKATPKYRQVVAVKELNRIIQKKMGTKTTTEFKQICGQLK
jgi:Flp pilus assembly protein TadD